MDPTWLQDVGIASHRGHAVRKIAERPAAQRPRWPTTALPQTTQSQQTVMPVDARGALAPVPARVDLHPLVLLSVADHCARTSAAGAGARKRVVGVLLGEFHPGSPPDEAGKPRARALDGARPVPASDAGEKAKKKSDKVDAENEGKGEGNGEASTAAARAAALAAALAAPAPVGGVVEVISSFALPFEEDPSDPDVWFLDHGYLEAMFAMQRKVNGRERVVGWYSAELPPTGAAVPMGTSSSLTEALAPRASDARIHALLETFCDPSVPRPVFAVAAPHLAPGPDRSLDSAAGGAGVGARQLEGSEEGLPLRTYVAVGVGGGGGDGGAAATPATPSATGPRELAAVPVSIRMSEAEEIGIEHLLRDVRGDGGAGRPIAARVAERGAALRCLASRVKGAADWLDRVAAGEAAPRPGAMADLQRAAARLPEAPGTVAALLGPDAADKGRTVGASAGAPVSASGGGHADLRAALARAGNDAAVVTYAAAASRAVAALHSLIANQELRREEREEAERKARERRGVVTA